MAPADQRENQFCTMRNAQYTRMDFGTQRHWDTEFFKVERRETRDESYSFTTETLRHRVFKVESRETRDERRETRVILSPWRHGEMDWKKDSVSLWLCVYNIRWREIWKTLRLWVHGLKMKRLCVSVPLCLNKILNYINKISHNLLSLAKAGNRGISDTYEWKIFPQWGRKFFPVREKNFPREPILIA